MSPDGRAAIVVELRTRAPFRLRRTAVVRSQDRMHTSELRVILRSAAVSSAGPRSVNQDSACAGPQLVAIADGGGGNGGGAVASSLVIDWLIRHGHPPLAGATEVELGLAIAGANDRLRAVC